MFKKKIARAPPVVMMLGYLPVDDKLQALQMSLWVCPIRQALLPVSGVFAFVSLTPQKQHLSEDKHRPIGLNGPKGVPWGPEKDLLLTRTDDSEQRPEFTLKSSASGHYPDLQFAVYQLSRIQAGFVFSAGRENEPEEALRRAAMVDWLFARFAPSRSGHLLVLATVRRSHKGSSFEVYAEVHVMFEIALRRTARELSASEARARAWRFRRFILSTFVCG